ncbi:MAG: ACP S-malonyltransferase [Dehalococcoidales bacterium]|nr:ACP S-malonyltransferase [Dehalococcoidales bacterium]
MTELKKVAYVFPGQGAQHTGMGQDVFNDFPSARALFEQADESLGFSLSQICFNGPDDELIKTINVQPAIVTTSIALLSAAEEQVGSRYFPKPCYVAGHSLGEYTALAVAGVLPIAETVCLARERGRLMYQAGQINPGSMAAIIGLDENTLAEICDQSETYIANYNCPGQMVISGKTENIEKAGEMAKTGGAMRVIPLQVSGAFHTPLMSPASQGLSDYISVINFKDADIPIIANTTAQAITSSDSIKQELINQLCQSVQWQSSIEFMINDGVDTFIEIGPGKVLCGMIKRINKEVRTINICDIESIKKLDFASV